MVRKKRLGEDLAEGDFEENVERRAALRELGAQDRALPGVDDELRERFGREAGGDVACLLGLGDDGREHVAPCGKSLADPARDERTLRGQLGAEVSQQAPGG